MHYTLILELFFVSIILSSIGVYLLYKSPVMNFFLDTPDIRKIHQRQIPRIGGIAILTALFALIGFLFLFHRSIFQSLITSDSIQIILIASLFIFILGFFDDSSFITVRVRYKLLVEFTLAFVAVAFFNMRFPYLSFLGLHLDNSYLCLFISFFWIIGITNAFNIIDGIDGLAGCLSLISIVSCGIIFTLFGQSHLVYICSIFSGLILGFLFLNKPPAKVFLGDTGSLLVGTIVAFLSIKVISIPGTEMPIALAFCIAALPILEVFVSMIRRYGFGIMKKESLITKLHRIIIPDSCHIHHMMLYRGYSHTQILIFYAFLSLFYACIGFILTVYQHTNFQIVLICYSILVAGATLARIGYGNGIRLRILSLYTSLFKLKKKKKIAILGADASLKHSFSSYVQNEYDIDFVQELNKSKNIINYNTFIIYNNHNLSQTLELLTSTRTQKESVVVAITEAEKVPVDGSPKNGKHTKIYLTTKPIDISCLFNDLKYLTYHPSKSDDLKLRYTRVH